MTLHLELAQGARNRASYDAPVVDGCVDGCVTLRERQRTELLGVEGWAELDRSQFIRLGESVPCLQGLQVQLLKELCLHANCSEEFFLSDSKDQWLRTAITGENALFSSEVKQFLSHVTIQSLVLPWHLYWPKLEAMGENVASERVSYFPVTVLEAALSEESSLTEQLKEREGQCTIANQWTGHEETITSRPFWKIAVHDVKAKTLVGEGSQAEVGRVLWRGGLFARKVYNQKHAFDAELEVVRKVSHPHVVYSFGVCISPQHYSLLMELLDSDLFVLIEDQMRPHNYSMAPFRRLVALDILLQVAKAMTHMHGMGVVHGDLKPKNVLVSHCDIVGGVGQYFVKVADFGSAKILSNSRFSPEECTTQFAAPEVLQAISQKTAIADDPKKIDVYSFGILAFQVVTGIEPYKSFPSLQMKGVSSRGDLKKGVIAGTLRPPLREACTRPNFWKDPELLDLVESCWDPQPSNRPHFSDVIDHLERFRDNLIQKQTIVIDAPREARIETDGHANVVDDPPQFASATRSNGLSLHEANQVPLQNVQDKRKKASRRKGILSRHLMRWICMSLPKTID